MLNHATLATICIALLVLGALLMVGSLIDKILRTNLAPMSKEQLLNELADDVKRDSTRIPLFLAGIVLMCIAMAITVLSVLF